MIVVVCLAIGSIAGAVLMSLVSITRRRDVEAVVDALEKYLLCPAEADDGKLWGRVENAFYRAREG